MAVLLSVAFIGLYLFFRSTESAVSEHYHRSGVVAVHFAAYVVNPVLAVYARFVVLWSHDIVCLLVQCKGSNYFDNCNTFFKIIYISSEKLHIPKTPPL